MSESVSKLLIGGQCDYFAQYVELKGLLIVRVFTNLRYNRHNGFNAFKTHFSELHSLSSA